jgi:glutamyl-tRNA(Gln) amidotransferase subunit E
MRPRPGAARMYPETDIPPQVITEELIREVLTNLPEPAEKKIERLMKQYTLNEKLAKQIINSEWIILFEEIIKETNLTASTVAVFLTETIKALKRDGIKVENVSESQIKNIFTAVSLGTLTKEALVEVFSWLAKNENKTVQDATNALGLKMFTEADIEHVIDQIIAANKAVIEKNGKNAYGMLMGAVMKDVRGKATTELVSKILKQKL